MVRLRTGFHTYANGSPVRQQLKFAERRKPILLSQWPPESSEDDQDDQEEDESTYEDIESPFDRRVPPSEDDDRRSNVAVIDLSSDSDEAWDSGDDEVMIFGDDESSDEEDTDPSFEYEYEVPESEESTAASEQDTDTSFEYEYEVPESEESSAASEQEIESSSEDETTASEDNEPLFNDSQEAPGTEELPDAGSQPGGPAVSFSHRRLIASGSINNKHLDALADSGASFSVISQELADTLGLSIDQTSVTSVCLPNGTTIQTMGKAEAVFHFLGENDSYTLLCIVLEKCIHPLVLGSQFLRITQTLTKYTHRIKNIFSNILGLNFLAVLEAEQYLLDGYLNGQGADIVPDTGSDIMVMSLLCAQRLGLQVHDGPQHRTKIQFIDGSEAYTIGMVRGVKWRFQKYLDWGRHTLRRDGYEFHIIQHLPVDAIVNNDFIHKVRVFETHTHRLVCRRLGEAQPGIYGIRYIESQRAKKKKEQMGRNQISSAELEEIELHRRDAAEEDIEELLLTDPVTAETKRLEEQERRRVHNERKRRFDEAQASSMPHAAVIHAGDITIPDQQSSNGSLPQNANMAQQSADLSYQTQAGLAPGTSFDPESGLPQAKRRRSYLARLLGGSRRS